MANKRDFGTLSQLNMSIKNYYTYQNVNSIVHKY